MSVRMYMYSVQCVCVSGSNCNVHVCKDMEGVERGREERERGGEGGRRRGGERGGGREGGRGKRGGGREGGFPMLCLHFLLSLTRDEWLTLERNK